MDMNKALMEVDRSMVNLMWVIQGQRAGRHQDVEVFDAASNFVEHCMEGVLEEADSCLMWSPIADFLLNFQWKGRPDFINDGVRRPPANLRSELDGFDVTHLIGLVAQAWEQRVMGFPEVELHEDAGTYGGFMGVMVEARTHYEKEKNDETAG